MEVPNFTWCGGTFEYITLRLTYIWLVHLMANIREEPLDEEFIRDFRFLQAYENSFVAPDIFFLKESCRELNYHDMNLIIHVCKIR